MLEVISKVVDALIGGFDLPFMLSVNVLTWLIIKVISEHKTVSTWGKRIIAILCGAGLAVAFYFLGSVTITTLVYSFILSLVSWDFIFNPIIKFLKK